MNRILRKAIEIIHQHGWIQGSLHDEKGYCLEGALDRAQMLLYTTGNCYAIREEHDKARHLLRWIICERTQRNYDIIEWNDNVCQNADQAIEMLKFAAERAEQIAERAEQIAERAEQINELPWF